MSMIDEGAGELDSQAFRDRLERRAIEISFSASRDYTRGSLRTLKENRAEAFDLLRLTLASPRFDAEPMERIRTQLLSTPAARDHEPERARQQPLLGRRPSPAIPMAARPAARSRR